MEKDQLEAEFFYYETYFSIADKAYSEAKNLKLSVSQSKRQVLTQMF